LLTDAKFETHNNYVDVQLLLDGKERIYVAPRADLTENAPYSQERDITFYKDEVDGADYVTLDGTNFVLLYPHEAHAPQVSLPVGTDIVKKAVAKIRV
jgi:YhcH/YjgK/YiaL family protein